jgi:hypothetical protein
MKQIIFAVILVLGFGFSVFAQNYKSPCPTIDVSGGGVIQPREPMSFSVILSDETKKLNLEYEWTVSAGIITSGQGTISISVDTTDLENRNITATVKIKGLPENCLDTASETSEVVIQDPRLFDEYGNLPDEQLFARTQNLYAELTNNPDAQGYIVNYGTNKEITYRERQIKKAVSSLKLDTRRISIMRGGENPNGKGVWTKVWIVPSGAEIRNRD